MALVLVAYSPIWGIRKAAGMPCIRRIGNPDIPNLDQMTTANEWRSGKGHRDENFPVASWIIHPRHRPLILAFYNFVRTADDIADHAVLSGDEKLSLLDLLEAELLGNGDTQPEAVSLRKALAGRGMPPRHAVGILGAF